MLIILPPPTPKLTSMYRFNGWDGRLDRMLETTVMVEHLFGLLRFTIITSSFFFDFF